jgi:phage head maturation protease
MPIQQINKDILYRSDSMMTIESVVEESRTLKISFSSETEEVLRNFGTPQKPDIQIEILQNTYESIDLSRINAGLVCALFNHDTNKIMGKITGPVIEESTRKSYCLITFDNDEDSDVIFRKCVSGTIKGISTGYRVEEYTYIEEGETSADGRHVGPCYIATKWTPLEISLVAVPADSMVGVGRSMNTASESAGVDIKSEVKQLENKELETPAVKAEVQRDFSAEAVEILAICRGIDTLKPEQYIAAKNTVDEVRKIALEELKKVNAPIADTREIARVNDEAVDKFTRAAADAILLRHHLIDDTATVAEGAHEFRRMRMTTMMAEYATGMGIRNAHRMDETTLCRAVLTPDSQFAGVISNTINKAMLIGASTAQTTFQEWTGTGDLNDFKTSELFRLSAAGDLKKVQQNGEVTFDAMADEKVTWKLDTFAKKFGFTRQNLINDDMGMLSRIPAAYVRSGYRGINKAVYSILNDNSKTSYDNKAVFHIDHKNLAGTGTVPSIASLSLMRSEMRKQTDIRGKEKLNPIARYVICPPELETIFDQLYLSPATPVVEQNAGVVNPFQGRLKTISDAELEDAKAWFGAANPNEVDTITVGFLNGNKIPQLESFSGDADYLGILYRIVFDWGIVIADHRGLYKNPGA